MRYFLFFITTIILLSNLSAQMQEGHSKYEFLGNISYNYENVPLHSLANGGEQHIEKEQSITMQPTFGCFVFEGLEVLIDLQYMLSFNDDNYQMLYRGWIHDKYWIHRIGLRIGLVYNYNLNPFISVFVGSKIGTGWSRAVSDSYYSNSDSHWGMPEIAFPVFLGGAKYFITQNWAFLTSIQYSRISNYESNIFNSSWYRDGTDTITLYFGFSVFL